MLGVTHNWTIGADGFCIGVDEAGRGPLAGPVVAAAVVLGQEIPAGITDSKRLSARRRAALDLAIRETSCWAVGIAEPAEIDRINILQATMLAMTRAVAALTDALTDAGIGAGTGADTGAGTGALGQQGPYSVLIDGNLTPQGRIAEWRWPARAIIGGDATQPAISAASIIAKEWRDRLMCAAAQDFPQYGWERNKGYGSAEHMAALRAHGPAPLHRRSFAPVAQWELF